LEWYQIIIAIGGGLIAGIINTLAGNGSAITLSILTEVLGLPGTIANGTNRIGIALQTLSSSYTFQRGGVLDWKAHKIPVIIISSGALVGIVSALWVSNEQFMFVFRYLIVLMFFLLLIRPSRWLHPKESGEPWPRYITWPLLILLGFYGGFIQMGMGIFFLAIAVLGAKYTLLEANAIKVLVVGIYTIPAIILFYSQGKIEWIFGLTIGIGQLIGGIYTAKYAVKYPGINKLAYYALLIAVAMAIGSLFDFF
jgi:hypothetical protein